jgi:hypothetical protein
MITKVLEKIKKMMPSERNILGDKLLRDNLKELTLGLLAPSVDLISLEKLNIRESAIERAALDNENRLSDDHSHSLTKTFIDESIRLLKNVPYWIPENVPTIMLWLVYGFLFFLGNLFGFPSVFLVGAALILKIPEKAPLKFENILRRIFPQWFLYPKMYSIHIFYYFSYQINIIRCYLKYEKF